MSQPLAGKVCLVTGATRGIGKGIALQLCEAGATVYITGRTLRKPESKIGGSLEETVEEVEKRGGVCIPIQCDHTDDTQVAAVFDKIKRDRDGQLDLLVNNAYSAVDAIGRSTRTPFWEQEEGMWDTVNNVGLRNHYICTIHAARMMVQRKHGLVVNISSIGGLRYALNTPYGIGKIALDRMAADCAHELRRHNVAMLSLWPGGVTTEKMMNMMDQLKAQSQKSGKTNALQLALDKGESPEFSGLCIAKLLQDPHVMQKTGKILMTAELGNEYSLKDIDGHVVESMRSLSWLLYCAGWTKTSKLFPSWVKLPYFFVHMASSKF